METTWLKASYKLYIAIAMHLALRRLRFTVLFFALALILFIQAPKIFTGLSSQFREVTDHKSFRYDQRNMGDIKNEINIAKKSLIDNSSVRNKRRLFFGWPSRTAYKPEENRMTFKYVLDKNQNTKYAEIRAYTKRNQQHLQDDVNTGNERLIEQNSDISKHDHAKFTSNQNKDAEINKQGPLITRRNFWVQKFTKDIPQDLLTILEYILLREHERINNNNSNAVSEGRDSAGRCKRGYFQLKGMKTCEPWLKCDQVMKLETTNIYGNGVGKIVHAAKWKGMYDVAVVKLREDRIMYKKFVDRVQTGVVNILLTQPSPYTTQVVGYCVQGNNTVLVMEACEHGNFRRFYAGPVFRRLSMIDKFKFAIQVVAELDYLHRGLGLPRVHCDLHTVLQALGQYVVSYDFRLFLNDLDEIPEVSKKFQDRLVARCESEPYGKMGQPDFIAPEARYTVEEHEKGISRKGINEKADIWKIPDLTANILTNANGQRSFEVVNIITNYAYQDKLQPIHDRCKSIKPEDRPSAREILIVYLKLYRQLLKNMQRERLSNK